MTKSKKRRSETVERAMSTLPRLHKRKRSFYERYIKRGMDIICSLLAIVFFSWLYLSVAVMVRVKLGSPVLFRQPRPGMADPKTGRETVFYMYKFRSMSDERGSDGELLPDEERLGKFGKWLRSTSLDELPEAFNILRGDMSIIGPRPQLVRDMAFMSPRQRMRHTAKPGLSGLAQINGRNAINWEEKLEWDLQYIRYVTLKRDVQIILKTIQKAFFRQEGITEEDRATAEDFGDYLLNQGKITQKEYNDRQRLAGRIVKEYQNALIYGGGMAD